LASNHETIASSPNTSILSCFGESTIRYASSVFYQSFVWSRGASTHTRAYQTVPPIPDQPLPGLKDIPELLARFGRPRSVSVGPQSEIDVWEQLDYRDERRRRRSNSAESHLPAQENGKRLKYIAEQAFSDDTLLDDDDDRILRAQIEEPRIRYDVEVVTKLIVYAGTPFPFTF